MPNRVLRDWTTSESIDTLSVHAEVFFTRLIMKADDYGNYTANPKLLKAALFPLRDVMPHEIDKWITECITCGIIKKYNVEGKDYLNIPNFGQRLRAMKSHYPDLSQSNGSHTTVNSRLETKRNEVETEVETESELLSLLGIDVCIDKLLKDELWTSSIGPIAKGKDIGGAVRASFLYLQGAPTRFKNATLNDLKRVTLSWLENKKAELKPQDQRERFKNL